MKKEYYKYFIYISIFFLSIALIKADYLFLPIIFSPIKLIISFLLLFLGFFTEVISWRVTLMKGKCYVNFKRCLAAKGLSVFGKYMPGKIWIIAGPVVYISQKEKYSISQLSAVSIHAQLITLWVGLIFGSFGILLIDDLHHWGLPVFLLLLLLTVFAFTDFFHLGTEYFAKKILKKDIKLPHFSLSDIVKILPWYFIFWAFWSVGFYLFVDSVSFSTMQMGVGLGFPLAGTLGIMAVVVPGGLGVREGILAGYLSLLGLPLVNATSIAIASRLWFVIGEAFIFISGIVADRLNQKQAKLV